VNGIMNPPAELADLLAVHLKDEEAVLAEALPMVRALKSAFTQRLSSERIEEIIAGNQTLASLLGDIKLRRQRFLDVMARRMQCDSATITVSRIMSGVPEYQRGPLQVWADRVRKMAREFVAINRWLGVHLRIHLEAYQRVLCDLTGTASSSGRYGPGGATESDDFRPLLQIRG
jgi:hypothetical protein